MSETVPESGVIPETKERNEILNEIMKISSVGDSTESTSISRKDAVKQKMSKYRKKKKFASTTVFHKKKNSRFSHSFKTRKTRLMDNSKEIVEIGSTSRKHHSKSSRRRFKEEYISDDPDSSVSESYTAPLLNTRSRIRRMQRRKAYISNSSAESDNRRAKSEPILITLDSESEDNGSVVSSRPNRTARIKGEIIRKLSGTHVSKFKTCESSSSSDSDTKHKKKKKPPKPVKTPSVQKMNEKAKRSKYLTKQLAKKSKLKLKKHKKHNPDVYQPTMTERNRMKLDKLTKRDTYMKERPRRCNTLLSKKSHRSSFLSERRSLRNTSVDSTMKSGTDADTKDETSDQQILPEKEEPLLDSNLDTKDAESKDAEEILAEVNSITAGKEMPIKEVINQAEENVEKPEADEPNMQLKNTDIETDQKSPEDKKEETKTAIGSETIPSKQFVGAVKKIKKKSNPTDKLVRKRGRPRLTDIRRMPDLNDNIQIPILQTTFCFDFAPKLPKCRECLLAMKRTTRTMYQDYCRFMEYRKLCYSKNGVLLNAGFSVPSEATSEHLSQWLPQREDPPIDLNADTAKSLIELCGDQFCDLIEQEKEALSLHVGKDRVITWKRIVPGVREMCDVCYTTIFNMHWVCPICGLAVCIDCYKCRKQEIVVEYEDGQPKNRDEFNWLVCTLRQPHDPSKLVMAQIIPGNALWTMRDLLHRVRKMINIPSYCKCNPHEVTTPDKYVTTGICKQLMSYVTRSFPIERNSLYFNNDSALQNGENNYDDLDVEVTGVALKWLESAGNTNNLENLKNADEYFNTYEDFASLRGNLLNGISDEDIQPESEREFSSFSLDDIIACVTKPQNDEDKENSGKCNVKTFTNRYPQSTGGREPLPIRIYTKLESNLAFESVPHSWFCNGRLLFLHQADHKDNLPLFQEQWKRGQPILVKGVDEQLNMDLWHPDAFCRDFGDEKNDLVDCKTGAILKNLPMRKFWEGFECFDKRLVDDKGDYLLLKLKDWPPGEDFSEMLPKRFHDLMSGLPLPEYTRRDGILNLAGRLPPWFVRPDLGPKMYNAYGSALYPTKGTTNLHLDVSDAVNVMVYVGIPSDGNAQLHIEEALKAIDEGGCDSLMRARVRARGAKPGALWHIFNARDADKIRDLLTKVAIERGEKLEAHHDPIHDQSWYLDEVLRKRLYKDYGVEGYAIAQCLGDAVFIPAGAPHQVRNLHSCVKVAEDYVSPENIGHCFKLTQEFRQLSDTHTNHEDKLQIKNIIYHVVRDALSHLLPKSTASAS